MDACTLSKSTSCLQKSFSFSAIVEHARATYSRFPIGVPSISMPSHETGVVYSEEKVSSLSYKQYISHFFLVFPIPF